MTDKGKTVFPLVFVLAMSAEASADAGGESFLKGPFLRPGSLSPLIEQSVGRVAQTGQGRRLLPHLTQFFPNFPNFPNFANFNNCFANGWRNC